MAHPEGLSQWTVTVTRELPVLSTAQARVLALWSYGMMHTPPSCFLPQIHQEVAIAIHPCLIAGPEHNRRLTLLDDRWSCQDGSRRQVVAIVDRAVDVSRRSLIVVECAARISASFISSTIDANIEPMISTVMRSMAFALIVAPAVEAGVWSRRSIAYAPN